MKTESSATEALQCLRALARYQTHGGYSWAAVMSDGDTMCVPCVRNNYRQIFRATRDHSRDGWAVEGLASSVESDETEFCCNCGKPIWEHEAATYEWCDGSGRLNLRLTMDEAESVSHPGPCDDDVAVLARTPHIASQLAALNPDHVRAHLREYGCWDEAELADYEMCLQRTLWLAGSDVREDPERFR